jgi:hypothetical protein
MTGAKRQRVGLEHLRVLAETALEVVERGLERP